MSLLLTERNPDLGRGGGGAARLLILFLFSCSADNKQEAEVLLLLLSLQGTQKPYCSQLFFWKFGQVMKSWKNIFWFRSTMCYTKTTCGILENDADQWQVCQKMSLSLPSVTSTWEEGGGVLPDFFIYSCFMFPVQQTTRIWPRYS